MGVAPGCHLTRCCLPSIETTSQPAMTMMYQDRVTSIFWFWLFKSVQTCFAMRRPLSFDSGGGDGSDNDGRRRTSDSTQRRYHDGDHTSSFLTSSSYTRLGRLALSGDGDGPCRNLLGWSKWNNNRLHLNCAIRDVSSSSAAHRPVTTPSSSNFLLAGTRLCRRKSSSENVVVESPMAPALTIECNNDYAEDDFDHGYVDEDDNVYLDDVTAVTEEDLWTVSLTSTRTKRRKTRAPPSPPSDDAETDNQFFYAMTRPIVPITVSLDCNDEEWFASPRTIDLLAATGLEMAIQGDNEWIEWEMHDSTRKLLKESDEETILQRGEILVYVGVAKQNGHGSHLPIIKTKSILPLSASAMADLLMDSSKVKIYNKLSLGRTDVRILVDVNPKDKDVGSSKDNEGNTCTKIVCNLTQPPIAKSPMVSCTLMHSRRLVTFNRDKPEHSDHGNSTPSSYLVVSRAVPALLDAELVDLPRNDILLGVNLLEDRGTNECLMTAVTHVYSPALPTMLARSMGVSSAVNFVRDIRKACADTVPACQ